MSDIFGTPDQPTPTAAPERRRRVLVPTLVTVAVLIFLGSIFTNIYTDRLWFSSVGYTDVFTKVLLTRIGMFAAFGLLFALLVVGSAYLAWRFRPENPPARRDDPAVRYRQALSPILRPVTIVAALLLAAFAGSVAQGQWQTFQLWRAGGSFGIDDAHFSRDIGFYVFDYPWLRFLSTFGFTTVIITFVVTAFVLYVFGGIRVLGGIRFTRAAQVHLSVIVGVGLLLRAFSYYLDRYGYAVGNSSLFDGIGYTDAMARIPARNVLAIVAIVVALLFFAMIFLKSWTLPGLGLGGLLLASIVIGGIWPYAMQSFQVRPSEPDREGPYIAKNIEATREAYDVADSEVEDYTAATELSAEELAGSAESRVSSRLLDPTLISDAFQQLQQVRGYYTVPETLDVDRYLLEGSDTPQDVIIAAREVDLAGLQESQRTWSNDHTVYTHGYGVIAAYGNQRGDQGEPVWAVQDIPPVGQIETEIPPRIYFGENSPSYSIVGRPEGADPIEVDIPRGGGSGSGDDAGTDGDAQATQNTYDGEGGVNVGSLFHKVLYAVKFNEPNIVLSDRVNENSKILYDRHPRERVEKVAPWLTVDGDVYPAVVDGRVVWIVDGYTTSNSFPYSEHRSLRTATADTLTQTSAQAALPTDEINYMRNSVKAVVDAYDGSVKLYEWDEEDPILEAWMKVFPGTVEKKSEISDDLMSHLRYPVDLFKVQRDVLARYHVTDAQTFYEDGERWRVPSDPTQGSDSNVLQPPYYLTMARPGENESPFFSLTSVFLPNSRQNLASFVSVNSEASSDDYGTMQILQLPSDTQVPGPSQIANQFETDSAVTQALLPFAQSNEARILRGNLLTLPVGGALLYVQPVYIQRSAGDGSFPVLQFVAVSFGEDVGFGTTLEDALANALGLQPAQVPTDLDEPDDVDEGEEPPADTGTAKTTSQWLAEASAAYNAAQDALAAGDLAGYQQQIDAMNAAIVGAQESLPPGQ
ncbi:UPF0182 family protein [Aeromicrobium sp. Leaf350]|uniref:UPF0182 family membrane protein n=1 Tax=Aeromicrobium sp. Leaf350 TaxID=2876565 RepID=UPI001E2FBC02|nr:UPF0182 family protein [Aeromicrobium sp. Leaf350]